EAFYSYDVTSSDNCPFTQVGIVSHPIDFNTGQAGIMFDLVNLSGESITVTQFGPSLDAGSWPMEVYFTHTATTWFGNDQDPGAWVKAGSFTAVSSSPAVGTPIPGFGITIPANSSVGIYLTSTTGAPINFTTGSRQVSDGVMRVSSNPGAGQIYPFAGTIVNRSYNGFVRYSTTFGQAPTQISGIPSGEGFPIGVTTNVFQCVDNSGNTATCSFTVTVFEYGNPTQSLKCNDIITVALDEGCTGQIGADDALEGGPYGCYDNYEVRIDRTLPLGNGPWEAPTLFASDV
ncbi:MAG: HYR domain-containing protein, partial [Saprospiraceae bacterium]|nr:HYR domain-containing protein [Saprospiraceae bacterium]